MVTPPLRYTNGGKRLAYHPDYHPNHGKEWTVKELAYLCHFYETVKLKDLAIDLGRTHATIAQKKMIIERQGLFEMYRKMYKEKFL